MRAASHKDQQRIRLQLYPANSWLKTRCPCAPAGGNPEPSNAPQPHPLLTTDRHQDIEIHDRNRYRTPKKTHPSRS